MSMRYSEIVEELLVKVEEIIREMEDTEDEDFFIALEYADQLRAELENLQA